MNAIVEKSQLFTPKQCFSNLNSEWITLKKKKKEVDEPLGSDLHYLYFNVT